MVDVSKTVDSAAAKLGPSGFVVAMSVVGAFAIAWMVLDRVQNAEQLIAARVAEQTVVVGRLVDQIEDLTDRIAESVDHQDDRFESWARDTQRHWDRSEALHRDIVALLRADCLANATTPDANRLCNQATSLIGAGGSE